MMFLVLLGLGQSLQVRADGSADYFRTASNFYWTICGDAEIEFSIPVFIWDSSSNDGVTWGYIYATPDGENETQVMYYAYDSSRDQDKPTTFCAYVDGDFNVTNTTQGTVGFTRNDGSKSWVLKRDADNDDHHTAKIRWKVPYQWRGKSIKLRVKFRWDDKNSQGYAENDYFFIERYAKDRIREYNLGTYECPQSAEASIVLNDPMLAFDKSSAGYIMVPWYAQVKSLSDVKLRTVDASNGHVSITTVDTKKSLSGYVNIPMDRPYSSVVLSGSAVATNGVAIPGRLESSSIEIPMLHTPNHLMASMKTDGKVVLRWKIDLPNTYDIMEGDMFEVQRNMTGSTNADDAAWTTIGMLEYERTKGDYELIDSMMLDRYQGNPVTYRVRRQCTSMWSWVDAAKYAQVQIPANIALYGIKDATVSRSSVWNDEAHQVNFNFNMSGPEYDNENRFIIRTVSDWEKFAAMVNAGQGNLDAVMGGDVDISSSKAMVGSKDYSYVGIFDGNGYTLTVNYDTNEEFTAPFRYIASATIKNLHVDGTLKSSAKFIAGLVGRSESIPNFPGIIENCYVSATINSTVEGDASNGGLVAVHALNALQINNCRFDGSLKGDKCYDNGGLVGWNDGKTSFNNCLFAPSKIDTKYDGCETFGRSSNMANLTFINCYYTQSYDSDATMEIGDNTYRIIRSVADWNAFRDAVLSAKGNSAVNAILDTDLTIDTSCGTKEAPFHGTFDGNGHILNVAIKTQGEYDALFKYVNGATIKNLHVTGTIDGGIHSAGLIGRASGDNTINNVRVSAKITVSGNSTSGPHGGGFIGYAESGQENISNCLFDGTITAKAWNDSFAGAIIGWGNTDAPYQLTVKNNLENGSYVNVNHAGMNYATSPGIFGVIIEAYGGDNTNYSAHDWGEMASDANKNALDQYSANTLAQKLGSGWKEDGGQVVPVMAVQSTTQGEPATTLSTSALLAKLGDGWKLSGNEVVPVSTSNLSGGVWSATTWDKRAKLQLRINMHGEKGVESKIVDLSDNEEALKKHQFSQELSRKCVDYSFDLLVIRAKSPLKIVGEERDTVVYAVSKTETGDKANYRFQNSNRITKFEAKKKQSSVELTWEVSGGDYDFFRVLRRQHTQDANAAWTDTIATNLNQLFFEDKKVMVQRAYDYRVESVYQCEGTNIETMTCTGECEPTGMVNGYVRMADGTAMAGLKMICEPKQEDGSAIPGAKAQYITYTDETGYFEFRGLPYQENGRYVVSIDASNISGSFIGPNKEGAVTFTTSSNWAQNFNFYMDTYFVYSGNVYYRDTSIPVPGVSFKLDGKVMHDASQQVITTDNQGAFELSIPAGEHSVQAVKEGHYFANDGFLINEDALEESKKTLYPFNKNVASVFLWDSTTVMLRGRVVGGDIQGSKPLGQSLSTNNLGDSIKIVMQLEGDNTSWLIRKQNDATVKSATYNYHFGAADEDVTKVDVTRHTMTVWPDKKTGEYQLMLHPAKYKVIEVSGQGYPTLFQQGKVGETVDLSFNVRGDTCEYNRIYHAVPTLEVTQFNPGNEKYFGVKKLTANDNIGNKAQMTIWYQQKNKVDTTKVEDVYAFGYPVFMGGSPYGWILQACEKYYWNNKINGTVDIVNLSGGKVKIQNALTTDSKTAMWEKELDEQGGASYVFSPDNATFTMEGDNALKSVSITLEYDNSFYDIKPFNGKTLQGYVMATKAKSQGRKAVVSGTPKLFDILRDPPGGGSSAYIDAGTKLSYGYTWDLGATLGFSLKSKTGKAVTIYNGYIAAPQGQGSTAGVIETSKVENGLNVKLETNFGMSWTYNYNIDVTERIQTSSSKKWIGGKADIFIGTTENVVFEDAMAVRIIPDSMYQIVRQHGGGTFEMTDSLGNTAKIKVPDGTTKVLAQGTDDTGQPVYLVRDEVMQVYPEVSSTFIHTQHYIENELLPDLMKIRNSLLLPKGTDDSYAQTLANQRGYATYVSKVDVSDENYGLQDYYEAFYPEGNDVANDSISALNQEMYAWISMLAKNEQDKLSVQDRNLVKRYDFDGAANIQYSESFSTAMSGWRYCRYPLLSGFGNLGVVGGVYEPLVKAIEKAMQSGDATTSTDYAYLILDNKKKAIWIAFGETTTEISFLPIIAVNFNDKFTTSESYSKKTGFTLSASSKSSLTVDVYRTETQYTYDKDENMFYHMTDYVLDDVRNGRLGSTGGLSWVQDTTAVYSNFVFRTRAGVTCEPYEKERVTKWYQPGTVIDVATIPADKPRIWIDEPVVSNVPFNQPARFKLHMANESEYPERASLIFNYFLLASSNPDGAKVFVDGNPITSAGTNITLYPCRDKNNEVVVFDKEIEVWPGKEFDYNDLTLCLYDPDDANRVFDVKFSAHFIPTAGAVNVTTPGDKWVINTESPYDGKRKAWYMPVRIDGFDTNYRGFDHIELQYKLSTQGDKDWVNVCSYYADKELMKKVSGVTDTIPGDGIILAKFYGEVDPIEQYYDLRAVNYCRHAGGYLTNASPILSGIKDTRLPEIFGTPEPVTGILGIGDDIRFTFSEPIASNYLSKINNFEVLGTPNNNDISLSTSLTFDGDALAASQGYRNLTGKNFSVDIRLNPTADKKDMTVFTHGGEGNGLSFGLTADRHMTATINGTTVVSDDIVPFNNVLKEVVYTLDQSGDDMKVNFYNGKSLIGTKTVPGKYTTTSRIRLGWDDDQEKNFKGDMLEFRLWNRALSSNEINAYGNSLLTGYESGLLDYYQLNEGKDNVAYDKAPAAMDLMLLGTTWKRPAGISMKFDGKEGLQLNKNPFVRASYHDYTLMFWFRSHSQNATLFSNGEATSQEANLNQLNIGIKEDQLYIRSAGNERVIEKLVSDGEWHHFTMTVSRSSNVANVYIDEKMVDSFVADELAGVDNDAIALGATYVEHKATNVLTGNIDEVGMFESVLPMNLIKDFATHTPTGTMTSMMAFLDFGRSERQDDNTMRLQPTGISLKRYVDNQGNVLARRDTLIHDINASFVDRSVYAPITDISNLTNLNYKYVSDGKDLLVNIKEPDFVVEKTNIYVTVKEIPDLRGNLMSSPVTTNVYAYRNPLRWDVKSIKRDMAYGEGCTIEVKVKNLSGLRQSFTIDDLPVWISASQTEGRIDALDELTITLNVSPYINIGTYTEQLTLTGDNKMSEPLPITLNVRGEEPDWAVSDRLKQEGQTMMMVARVKIDGEVAHDKGDMLCVTDSMQQMLGVSHIEVDNTANANQALAYLTIYGYSNKDKSTPRLNFLFFDATTGKVHTVVPEDGSSIFFKKDAIIGTAAKPVEMKNASMSVQTLRLKKGWNWVSFNVVPQEGATLGQFLNTNNQWEAGDIITGIDGKTIQQWTCRQNKQVARGYQWDNEDQPMVIKPTLMYNIFSKSDKTIYLEGEINYDKMTVHKDWNRLAFLSTMNLPIAQALNDYTEQASAGDVIKSQDGFSVATAVNNGLVWKGSLQHMEAGKGYMLKRLNSSDASFYYPLYWTSNRYSGNAEARVFQAPVNTVNTMNIVASVNGVTIEEDDRLVVYSGAERLAEAVADSEERYYLNIGSDDNNGDQLTFTIEREGAIVAMTGSRISYIPNKVLGTPDEPTAISFTALDEMPHDGKWYTISGIQLQQKPTRSGLSIYNGTVKTIK